MLPHVAGEEEHPARPLHPSKDMTRRDYEGCMRYGGGRESLSSEQHKDRIV